MRNGIVALAGFIVLGMLPTFAQAPRLVWSDTFNGEPQSYPIDMSQSLIDEAGNLYLITSFGSRSPVIRLQKYDQNGAVVWEREWRHPQALFHRFVGADLDASGHLNLFAIAIISEWIPTLNCVCVVRFLQSGELLDTRIYRLPVSADVPTYRGREGAIAIDEAGNRYVAFSNRQNNLPGTHLIKLTPSWELAWSRFVPAFYSQAIHPASDGSLFLVGYGFVREDRTSELFLARAKVNASGDLLWRIFSEVPYSPLSYMDPPAWSAGSDASGHLYAVYPNLTVERYAPNGEIVARWDYPHFRPITYDAHILSDGRVVLAGSAGATYLVVALSPTLVTSWLRSDWLADPGNAIKIAVNQAGEVWVLLSAFTAEFEVHRLAPDGTTVWTRRIRTSIAFGRPVRVLVNASGQSVGLGGARYSAEALIFSLGANGELLYNQRFVHTRPPYDEARGLSVDMSDNSALLVYSVNGFHGLSYSPSGIRRWQVFALENGDFDSVGNWITVGSSLSNTTGLDPRVRKYAPNGQMLWDRTEHLSGTQAFPGMAITPDDSILVGGTQVVQNRWQPFLMKFTPEGQRLWFATHALDMALLVGLQAISDGSVYILAQSLTDNTSVLACYSATGTELWTVNLPVPPLQLLVDRWNNAFAIGFRYDRSAGRYLLVVSKFSLLGTLLWQNQWLVPLPSVHVIAPSGDLYGVALTGDRLIAHRISSEGTLWWTREFVVLSDQMVIAVDAENCLYIAASSWLGGSDSDNQLVVYKLEPSGRQQWCGVYALDPEGRTLPRAMRVDSAGRVLIAGDFTRETGDTDAFLLQLSQPLLGDANGDGCVNDRDLSMVLQAFGSTQGGSADLNGDEIVDDTDLLRVLFYYGSGC